MSRPLLVLEDVGAASRRPLFRLAGVTWAATRYAWVSPLFWAALGVAVALAERRVSAFGMTLLAGLGYGLMLYASNVVHSLGHLIAGQLVASPMQTNLLTSTRDVSLYREPGAAAPPWRRVGRALGGPVANLVCGGAALAVAALASWRWLEAFGLFNILVGLWTLSPVPSLDGWVIWRGVVGADRRGMS